MHLVLFPLPFVCVPCDVGCGVWGFGLGDQRLEPAALAQSLYPLYVSPAISGVGGGIEVLECRGRLWSSESKIQPVLIFKRGVIMQGFRLEFRVQGSGFRVQSSGFRVQVSGFRVSGFGFRVEG